MVLTPYLIKKSYIILTISYKSNIILHLKGRMASVYYLSIKIYFGIAQYLR